MPPLANVEEVGRATIGLPLTATVPSNTRVGGPISLDLKITNVTDHPCGYNRFDYTSPSTRFAVWIICNGKDVPLTKDGQSTVPRRTTWWSGGSAIPAEIRAGQSLLLHLRLDGLFQITMPGDYTAIIEDGPFMIENDDPRREVEAAKTSFTLLP